MPRYQGQSGFRHGETAAAAVLLVNLGTPAAPTKRAVRRYLAQFLADPRIVELSRWAWWPILHGVILRLRPARSVELYRHIWTEQGSPLAVGMAALTTRLEAALRAQRSGPILVRHAMRYGGPAIDTVMRELAQAGARRLLVLPLFPQYSGTTTGSAMDAVGAELATWRWLPDLRFVAGYHAAPRYIEALARSVEAHWQRHGRAQKLVVSFHGTPEAYLKRGDPYYCQCQETARRLRERLGLDQAGMIVSFQSRVGRGRWLGPATDATLADLPHDGVRHVQVLCPGFAVDCLETLEEIALSNHARFLHAGGERLEYIPALNDGADHVAALVDLILRNSGGWPEFAADWDGAAAAAQARAARTRHEQLRDGR
ncbi:MAG: ferrochelatase [Dokdonella sp.]|uniref:ferrochelatase n=1 Tax=Dokdonella sp. TaxID=2291710 RepID=UPI0025BDDBE1|nr:ferrochelatase [Dokdonella sp.]MBX3701867.1 ferrochelatase [Dokdonella sp.]MCW5579185.1 ferrochelatase [Dokdonella sp.]